MADITVTVSSLAGAGSVPTAAIVTDAVVSASALAGSGALGNVGAQLYRDADVLDDIEARLIATNAFDGVYRCSVSELGGRPSDHLRAVCIESAVESEADLWDSYDTGPMEVVSSQAAIVILVRHPDPRERDRILDRLKSVTRNAIARRSLAGITMPDFTRFTAFQTQKPIPPERQTRGTFAYRYLVDEMTGFAEND